MAEPQKTVTVSVAALGDVQGRVRAAFAGEPQGNHITFTSLELLWSTLNEKRMAILRAMTGSGPLSIRETARRLGRDIKAVHGDVQRLLACGLLQRTEDGKVHFPYDVIHLDVVIRGEAAA